MCMHKNESPGHTLRHVKNVGQRAPRPPSENLYYVSVFILANPLSGSVNIHTHTHARTHTCWDTSCSLSLRCCQLLNYEYSTYYICQVNPIHCYHRNMTPLYHILEDHWIPQKHDTTNHNLEDHCCFLWVPHRAQLARLGGDCLTSGQSYWSQLGHQHQSLVSHEG